MIGIREVVSQHAARRALATLTEGCRRALIIAGVRPSRSRFKILMTDPLRSDRPALTGRSPGADRDARVEQLLLAGLDHYFAGQYELAISVWTRALFLDHSHARARAYIERARSAIAERQRESEELLHTGVEAFGRGDVGAARRLLTSAVERGAAPRRRSRCSIGWTGSSRRRSAPAVTADRRARRRSGRLTAGTAARRPPAPDCAASLRRGCRGRSSPRPQPGSGSRGRRSWLVQLDAGPCQGAVDRTRSRCRCRRPPRWRLPARGPAGERTPARRARARSTPSAAATRRGRRRRRCARRSSGSCSPAPGSPLAALATAGQVATPAGAQK